MTASSAGGAPPRILFIGRGESSHARNWIDLFKGSGFDVRLFSMPTGSPPDDWPVTTYVSQCPPVPGITPGSRVNLYPGNRAGQELRRFVARFGTLGQGNIAGRWLGRILAEWKPDVIQTIGIRYASYFLLHVRKNFVTGPLGKWVVQDWGPDLTMDRLLDEHRPRILEILHTCDGYFSDNAYNIEVARSLGLTEARTAPVGPVLATGGVDAAELRGLVRDAPSRRERRILWPKAYNCAQSTAYPVFEALKLCWERIAPCTVRMTAMSQEDIRLWFAALPDGIRRNCTLEGRIDRPELLQSLASSRVMLAPTLSDGMPNVLAEAMAMGTVPVVSPLAPITAHLDEENILFARNLYPDEIADALVRAMNDDALADRMARTNMEKAPLLFDRARTREKMLSYYESLAARAR